MVSSNIIYTAILILTSLFPNFPETENLNLISEFNNIETTPEIIIFTNDFEINNTDGHLQGIQKFENDKGEYVFMSGSSNSYSYCSVVKLGNENKVISINKLMEKPF